LSRSIVYTVLLVGLGLCATACTESPTSPSSATVTTGSGTDKTASGTTSTSAATTAANAANANPNNVLGFSLRFQGTANGEKVPVDPQVPADVGGDFTIEFWMKAEPGGNTSAACQAGEDGWRFGNVILDRGVTGSPDHGEYGLSLSGGRIAFGVASERGRQTVCGLIDVADNRWHHVAATRRASDGQLRVYVDGTESAQGNGPVGDVSYRDGRPTTSASQDPFLVLGGAKQSDIPSITPRQAFSGWLDDVRVSSRVRYAAPFDRPQGPLSGDADTVVLFHFDEGPLGPCSSSVLDSSGHGTHGQCRQSGAAAPGPAYVADTPFTANNPRKTAGSWLDEQ
jgi:hypothetical protein